MAGTTTAARLAYGSIVATKSLAPVDRFVHIYSASISTNSNINNISTLHSEMTDLLIFGQSSNQSTQNGWGYVNLRDSSYGEYGQGRIRYSGNNIGQSWDSDQGYTFAMYHNGYSNYPNMYVAHVANAFRNDVPKLCNMQWASQVGNNSWICHGGNNSFWNSTNKIDNIYIYDNYGSGSSSYQHYSLYGIIRK